MRVQQTVRDRDLSLQQSAIHEALAGNASLKREDKDNLELAASRRAQTIVQTKQLNSRATAGAPQAPAGDTLLGPLRNLITRYSTWDPAWIKPVWLYVKYYVVSRLPATYRSWKGYIKNDITYGMMQYRLPSRSKVLLIGDWGTHMPDNAALLRQAVQRFEPDAIIHLGDVYYSGTQEECIANVLNVMDQTYKGKKRPPFFTIPGNHDYYAGGGGFYHTIDNVNSGITGCQQQASFFCLRTDDNKWQFLGMDTGYNDRDPTNQLIDPEGPDLRDDEMEWHSDKLKPENFAGSTILLSHHQLISAKEQLDRQEPHYYNRKLFNRFAPYLDHVSAWFWGHEHNLILFEDNLVIEPGKPALTKGRLLGCSAYEESVGEDPFKQTYEQARFIKDMKQLGPSTLSNGGGFYNHAFAILDIAPEQITATYYEYPSWGLDNPQPSDPPIGNSYHPETILPKGP